MRATAEDINQEAAATIVKNEVNRAHGSVTKGGILCGQTELGQGFRHPTGTCVCVHVCVAVSRCVCRKATTELQTRENYSYESFA